MPIRYLVLGVNADGRIIERWFLRSENLIDQARIEMYLDRQIIHVVVVGLCRACSGIRVSGKCLNAACPTRVKWLEAAHV